MKRMLRAMMMLPIVGQVDSLLQLDNFIRAQDSPTYTTLQLHVSSQLSLSLLTVCLSSLLWHVILHVLGLSFIYALYYCCYSLFLSLLVAGEAGRSGRHTKPEPDVWHSANWSATRSGREEKCCPKLTGLCCCLCCLKCHCCHWACSLFNKLFIDVAGVAEERRGGRAGAGIEL